LPSIDVTFNATLPRKALAEPILLLVLGWVLSRVVPWWRTASYAPSAVAGATLLLLFWMIPRSIDLTQIYPDANSLYVLSLFTVGFLLSHYLPLLPGIARAVYALHFSSMIVALGLLYASLVTLCALPLRSKISTLSARCSFPLGLVLYLLALVSMPRWLSHSKLAASG
jgi:hypothetical protein